MSAPCIASGAKPDVRIDGDSILLAAQPSRPSHSTNRQPPMSSWHPRFSALAQGETWQKARVVGQWAFLTPPCTHSRHQMADAVDKKQIASLSIAKIDTGACNRRNRLAFPSTS